MKKKIVIFIVFGLLIGAQTGVFFGPVLHNPPLAAMLGALGGGFLGGFAAAIYQERQKSKPANRSNPPSKDAGES
jgi:membrane associated rhomboid family serine protease